MICHLNFQLIGQLSVKMLRSKHDWSVKMSGHLDLSVVNNAVEINTWFLS